MIALLISLITLVTFYHIRKHWLMPLGYAILFSIFWFIWWPAVIFTEVFG